MPCAHRDAWPHVRLTAGRRRAGSLGFPVAVTGHLESCGFMVTLGLYPVGMPEPALPNSCGAGAVSVPELDQLL